VKDSGTPVRDPGSYYEVSGGYYEEFGVYYEGSGEPGNYGVWIRLPYPLSEANYEVFG
jgi:hypothetical protein